MPTSTASKARPPSAEASIPSPQPSSFGTVGRAFPRTLRPWNHSPMSLPPPSEHPLIQAAIAETETLHAFFESWLGADPPTPESFARVEAALAPTFTLIGPDGRRESRDAVIAALQAERGARGPDFRIRVEAPEPVAL